MKKTLLVFMFITISVLAFAQYQVGDVVDDYSWTDDSGTAHTLYELTAEGKVVVMFWGGTG